MAVPRARRLDTPHPVPGRRYQPQRTQAITDNVPLSVIRARKVAQGRGREALTASVRPGIASGMRVSYNAGELERGGGSYVAPSAPIEWPPYTDLWAIADIAELDTPAISFDTSEAGAVALSPDTAVQIDGTHVYQGAKALRIDPTGRATDPTIAGTKPYAEPALVPLVGLPAGPTFSATTPANGWVRSWDTIAAAGRYTFAPSSPTVTMTDGGGTNYADVASPAFAVIPGQRLWLGLTVTNCNVRLYYSNTPDFGFGDVVAIWAMPTLTSVTSGAGTVALTGTVAAVHTVPTGVSYCRLVYRQVNAAGTNAVAANSGSSYLMAAASIPLGIAAAVTDDIGASFRLWTQRGTFYRCSLRAKGTIVSGPNLVPDPDLVDNPSFAYGCTPGWRADGIYGGTVVAAYNNAGETGVQFTGLTSLGLIPFPVASGERITVAFRGRRTHATLGNLDVSVYFGNGPAFTWLTTSAPATIQSVGPAPAAWTAYSATITVPPGFTWARICVTSWDGAPGAAIAVRAVSARKLDPQPIDKLGDIRDSMLTEFAVTQFIGRGGWEKVTLGANPYASFAPDTGATYLAPMADGSYEAMVLNAYDRWNPQLQIEAPVVAWLDDVRAGIVNASCTVVDHVDTSL